MLAEGKCSEARHQNRKVELCAGVFAEDDGSAFMGSKIGLKFTRVWISKIVGV